MRSGDARNPARSLSIRTSNCQRRAAVLQQPIRFPVASDPDGKCNGVHHLFFISDRVGLSRLAKVLPTPGGVFGR
jgi:hypothetical protein